MKCDKRLCALVDRGSDYECIIEKHFVIPEGIICEACYVPDEKGKTTERYRKRILLAVDGSDGSMEAVSHVAKVVSPKRASVLLLHVKTRAEQAYRETATHPLVREQTIDIVEMDGRRKRTMEEFMKRARQILLDAGFSEEAVQVEIREKQAGVVRDIVAVSKEGYTTIVVGRKGLSKLKDAILGNVTARLLERKVDIPVWVI
jgi:nucleotide-binding universal stress UspA family protein